MRALLFDAWPGSPLTCGSGLGSSLLKLPAAEDARAAGWQVDLLTSPAKAELLRGAAPFTRRFSQPEQVPWEAYDRLVPLGLPVPAELEGRPALRADPRPPAQLKRAYDRVPHVQFWRQLVAAQLGLPAPVGPARMRCEVLPEERAWADARLPTGRPLVALSLSALTHLKRYPEWLAVAQGLHAAPPRPRLVLVGQEPPGAAFPAGTIDLTRGTSFAQLAGVLARSAVVVGTDGLITNLAIALGRPTVALFTVIRPEFVVDPALTLRAPVRPLVHTGCPLQFCYDRLGNYRTAACPRDPALGPAEAPLCAQFPPEAVVAEVLGLLRSPRVDDP